MAVLNSVGTVPEERDSFRILVMMRRSESRCSKRSGVGMGSRSQDVFIDCVMILRTNCSDTGENSQSAVPVPVNTADTSEVSGERENVFRIVSILSVKNCENSPGSCDGSWVDGIEAFAVLPNILVTVLKSSLQDDATATLDE